MNYVKLPPNDNDAEEAVIGSLLIDGTSIFQIADFLQPSDFYFEQNRLLFEAAMALYQRPDLKLLTTLRWRRSFPARVSWMLLAALPA